MKRILFVALSLVLVACSSTDEAELALEPAELIDIDSDVRLKVVWSDDVGAGSEDRYSLLTPAILGDRVYATDAEGQVIAYELESGDDLWETELDVPVSGGAGVSADSVFVGTYTGEVIALSTEDGSEQWRAQLTSEVLAAPQSNGRVVVVQTTDGALAGLDANDGRQLWFFDNSIPVLTLRGTAAPLVTDTAVYAGFSTGKLVALNVVDGSMMWQQRVAISRGRSEIERVVDVDGTPLLVDDVLYAASYQGRLVAVNRATGRGLWAQDVSTHTELAAGFGNIYHVSDEGKVSAFNANSGDLVWENDQLKRRQLGAPQTFDNYLAVGDFEGYLHVLNQSDGQLVARRKVDGAGLRSPMKSHNGVLFVQGNGGELEAIKIK